MCGARKIKHPLGDVFEVANRVDLEPAHPERARRYHGPLPTMIKKSPMFAQISRIVDGLWLAIFSMVYCIAWCLYGVSGVDLIKQQPV